MNAISFRQYPTTSLPGQAGRELRVGSVGLSVPWSRLVSFVTKRTTVMRRAAEAERKPNVERLRSANLRSNDARAPRAAGSGGVALAARRD